MKSAFITGVTGFAGSFLAEHLIKQGVAIHGVVRSTEGRNIEHIKNHVTLHQVDLQDTYALTNLIDKLKPDTIYHLAALTSPAESFKKPLEVFTNNISLEISLLEAVKKTSPHTKVLITSSAEVYGAANPDELPLNETASLRPTSPYAVSKIAQDYLALQYHLSHKLNIYRVRPFNHIGPRQTPSFVVAAFASQIAEIEKGKKDAVIKVGNLDARRDFTDVRDMVKAYSLILEKGIPGEVYNVGSGASYKIADILTMLLSYSEFDITVEKDTEKVRPSDIPDIICDNTKINNLGWTSEIALEQTLKDTLGYWRNIV